MNLSVLGSRPVGFCHCLSLHVSELDSLQNQTNRYTQPILTYGTQSEPSRAGSIWEFSQHRTYLQCRVLARAATRSSANGYGCEWTACILHFFIFMKCHFHVTWIQQSCVEKAKVSEWERIRIWAAHFQSLQLEVNKESRNVSRQRLRCRNRASVQIIHVHCLQLRNQWMCWEE